MIWNDFNTNIKLREKKAGTVAFRSIAVTLGFRIGGTAGLSGTTG